MAKQPNIGNLASGFRSSNKLNDNFDEIRNAFSNTLSRDGSGPNQMLASLDMNSERILNLPEPVNDLEPVRLQDLRGFYGLTAAPLSVTVFELLVLLNGDWSYAIQAALNTGRNVYIPPGTYLIKRQLNMVAAGQFIEGAGIGATRLSIPADFDLSAQGVLFIPVTADEIHAGITGVSFDFYQPDSANRADYIQYPYAISARGATRLLIGTVRVNGGWNGFDLRDNTGGLQGDIWELGCLNEALTVGSAAGGTPAYDFWHVDTIHIWCFGFTTANRYLAYRDGNTVGLRMGEVDGLDIKTLSTFCAKVIIEAPGGLGPFGTIGSLQLDGQYATLTMAGGNLSVGNGYLTTDRNEHKLQINGGTFLHGPINLTGINTSTLALVYVGAAYASFTAGHSKGASPNAPVFQVNGGYLHVADVNFVGIGNQVRTVGLIRQSSGVLSATGNIFDNIGTGSGNAIDVVTNTQNNVISNSFGGWGLSLPSTATLGTYWPNANVSNTSQRTLAELTANFLGIRRVNIVDVYRGLSDAAGTAALQAIAQGMVDNEIELYQPSGVTTAVTAPIVTNGWLNADLQGTVALIATNGHLFEFNIDRDTTKKYFKAAALNNQTTGPTPHTTASAALAIKSTDNTKFCTYNDIDIRTNGFYSALKTDMAAFTTSFGQESTFAWNRIKMVVRAGVKGAQYGWYGVKGSGTGTSLRGLVTYLTNSATASVVYFEAGAYVVGDVLIEGHFGGLGSVFATGGGSQYRSNINLAGQADAGLTKAWNCFAGEEWSYLNDEQLQIGGGVKPNWPPTANSKLRGRQVQNLEDGVTFNTDALTLQNLDVFRFTHKPVSAGRGAGTTLDVHFSGIIGGVAYGEYRATYVMGNNGTTTTVTAVGTPVNTFGGGFVVSLNVSGLVTTLRASFTPSGTGTIMDCNIIAKDGRVYVEPLI